MGDARAHERQSDRRVLCLHLPHLATGGAPRDRKLLLDLADWATRFSPLVQPLEPDTLLLDISGCQRLFAGEHNLARLARAGLRDRGLHARAAVADTVGAAYALAVASVDEVVICPPQCSSACLAPLPPAALRIDPQIDEQLFALGVRTIGDLLMLPQASLPARFGPQLVLRLQQALGEMPEPLDAFVRAPPSAVERTFDGPLRDLSLLQSAAGRLLEQLSVEIVQRGLAVCRLDCVLVHERQPPTALRIGLSRPSRAWKHVAELLCRRLERVDLSPGVTGLSLIAAQTARWRGGQGELFEPREPGGDEALGCLIDRIVERLGDAAVVQADLVDDHQPELAYRYNVITCEGDNVIKGLRELAGAPARGEPPATRRNLPVRSPVITLSRYHLITFSCPPRPMRLLPRPAPIHAVAVVPDGPPVWFEHRGGRHGVAQAWGPERLETGWWRGADVRRDYFRVRTDSGEQYWLFRDRRRGTWWLHGVYA